MDTRLLWLALGGFAGALESFLIGSLLPDISADMSVTIGQAGLLVFGYALVHGIGTPVLAGPDVQAAIDFARTHDLEMRRAHVDVTRGCGRLADPAPLRWGYGRDQTSML